MVSKRTKYSIKKRSIILLFVLIQIIHIAVPCIVIQASGSSVSLEAVDQSNNIITGPIIGDVGDILTIYLKINSIQNFAGAHVNIAYDPNILQNVNNLGNQVSYIDSSGNDLTTLRNDNYNPFNSFNRVNHTEGRIEFSRSYTYLEQYRNDGVAETTGRMAKVRFKIKEKVTTSVYFQDTTQIVLQGGHDGTLVTNWDEDNNILGVNEYDVQYPQSNPLVINPPVEPSANNVTVSSISGLFRVGKQLSASYTFVDLNGDLESGSTYRWLRSDTVDFSVYQAIDGAVSLNYTPTTLDEGKYIRFEVTPKSDIPPQLGQSVQSNSVGPIEPMPPPAAPEAQNVKMKYGGVDIDENTDIFVGYILEGDYTYFDINDDTESGSTYKWYRSETVDFSVYDVIDGANLIQYTLTSADYNKYIKFEVTPKTTIEPFEGIPVKSSRTAKVLYEPTAPIASGVSISGTAEVGQTLTGNYTYFDINDDTESGTTFRWLSSDSVLGPYAAISGATSESYTIQNSDFGKYIKFEVTPKNNVNPNTGLSVQSSATDEVVYPPTAPEVSNVVISGITYVGQSLTGAYTFFDLNGDPDASTYRWLRSDAPDGTFEPIPGANSITYLLTEDDAWQYLRLEITAKTNIPPALGNTDVSEVTAQIRYGAIEPMARNVKITHTVNGTVYDAINSVVYAGELLTGEYEYFDLNMDPESGTTFRWLRSDTPNGVYTLIFGATSQTYMLTHADSGKYIKFEVTPKTYEPPQEGVPVKSVAIGPIGYLKVSGYVSPNFELSQNAFWSDKFYHKSNFRLDVISGVAWVSTVTDESGYFEFYLPAGQSEDYIIRISKNNYLSRQFVKRVDAWTGNVVLANEEQPLDMWIGDFEPDLVNILNSIIDINDVNKVGDKYNYAIEHNDVQYKDLDINKDGIIGLIDIMIVAKNYLKRASDYPIIN